MTDDRTLGQVLHEARQSAGEQRPRPWPIEDWKDRGPQLQAVDEAMAAAVEAAAMERLRTHEHEWTRCPECKQPGQPCPCSGVPCCEMERREIAATSEAARDERREIAAEIREYAMAWPPGFQRNLVCSAADAVAQGGKERSDKTDGHP